MVNFINVLVLVAACVAPAMAQNGCRVNLLDVSLQPGRQQIGTTCVPKGGRGVIQARGANWFVRATTSCGVGFVGNQGGANISLQHGGPC